MDSAEFVNNNADFGGVITADDQSSAQLINDYLHEKADGLIPNRMNCFIRFRDITTTVSNLISVDPCPVKYHIFVQCIMSTACLVLILRSEHALCLRTIQLYFTAHHTPYPTCVLVTLATLYQPMSLSLLAELLAMKRLST